MLDVVDQGGLDRHPAPHHRRRDGLVGEPELVLPGDVVHEDRSSSGVVREDHRHEVGVHAGDPPDDAALVREERRRRLEPDLARIGRGGHHDREVPRLALDERAGPGPSVRPQRRVDPGRQVVESPGFGPPEPVPGVAVESGGDRPAGRCGACRRPGPDLSQVGDLAAGVVGVCGEEAQHRDGEPVALLHRGDHGLDLGPPAWRDDEGRGELAQHGAVVTAEHHGHQSLVGERVRHTRRLAARSHTSRTALRRNVRALDGEEGT